MLLLVFSLRAALLLRLLSGAMLYFGLWVEAELAAIEESIAKLNLHGGGSRLCFGVIRLGSGSQLFSAIPWCTFLAIGAGQAARGI